MKCPDILDFEASGFGPSSYPIEVGYSLSCGERFCMLIRPHSTWAFWDKRAEDVHGISRELLLRSGVEVDFVCRELNQRLAGRTLYSDAWVSDKLWLNTLYEVGGLQPEFHLSAIENIQSECQYLMWDQVRAGMSREVDAPRHRASSDAEFIQRVFLQTRALCQKLDVV